MALRKMKITHMPHDLKKELRQINEALSDAMWEGREESVKVLTKRKELIEYKISIGETHDVDH